MVGHFVDTEEDDTAVGVGEGRVGLPDAVGQSAFGFFCFYAVVFLVFSKDFYVQDVGHVYGRMTYGQRYGFYGRFFGGCAFAFRASCEFL